MENVRFLGTSRGPQGRSFLRDYWSVDRAVAGTTAATHSNGATLTRYYPDAAGGGAGSISATDGTTTVDPTTSISFPAGTLSDLGSGVAGVGLLLQVVSQDIAFDTPSITTSRGVEVSLLAPGTVVIKAFPVVNTTFHGDADTAKLTILMVTHPPDLDDYDPLSTFDAVSELTPNPPDYLLELLLAVDVPANGTSAVAVTECSLRVNLGNDTNFLSGQATVYAIIATPSS